MSDTKLLHTVVSALERLQHDADLILRMKTCRNHDETLAEVNTALVAAYKRIGFPIGTEVWFKLSDQEPQHGGIIVGTQRQLGELTGYDVEYSLIGRTESFRKEVSSGAVEFRAFWKPTERGVIVPKKTVVRV